MEGCLQNRDFFENSLQILTYVSQLDNIIYAKLM